MDPQLRRKQRIIEILDVPFPASLICKYDYYIHGSLIRTLKSKISTDYIVILPNDTFAIASIESNNIELWEGEQCFTLQGHTDRIMYLGYLSDKIISGSFDNTLRIWDIYTKECDFIFTGHTALISCIFPYKDKIISAAYDSSIRIWNLSSSECEMILEDHIDMITHIKILKDGRVISASHDKTLRVWK